MKPYTFNGGGTDRSAKRYPCDIEYSNGRVIIRAKLTRDAYATAPRTVRGMTDLRNHRGVRRDSVRKGTV